MSKLRVLTLGDTAFTIEFSDLTETQATHKVRQIYLKVKGLCEERQLVGVHNLIPGLRSLTVCFDPLVANSTTISEKIISSTHKISSPIIKNPNIWNLPACYEKKLAPDVESVAKAVGLSCDEVISFHAKQTYNILAIGFLPGFPFMGEIPEKIRLPRLKSPRVKVPAGSVAIANSQTAIYPWESPGGWHLIARCPVTLFDKTNSNSPSLLQVGDKVNFQPVTSRQFEKIKNDMENHTIHPSAFMTKGGALQ